MSLCVWQDYILDVLGFVHLWHSRVLNCSAIRDCVCHLFRWGSLLGTTWISTKRRLPAFVFSNFCYLEGVITVNRYLIQNIKVYIKIVRDFSKHIIIWLVCLLYLLLHIIYFAPSSCSWKIIYLHLWNWLKVYKIIKINSAWGKEFIYSIIILCYLINKGTGILQIVN